MNEVEKVRKDDIIWKVVMEEVFDDLLRFISPDADQVYDLSRGFEFLEKELSEMYPEPDRASDTRFADKLVKVYTKDGQEEWVLLHVEIQGDTSRRQQFSERMFRYFYRILDWHRRPVSAVAIFTGQDGQKMPGQFVYEYRKTRLLYEYDTLSILDFTDEELIGSDNPFALVVLAAKTSLLEEKIPEQELPDRKLLIAKELFKRGYSSKKIRAIYKFLENVVLFVDPEMNRIFKEEIKLTDKNNVMGIDEYVKQEGIKEGLEIGLEKGLEKGIEKGLEKGREESARLFLSNTEFSVDKIAGLVGVPVAFVEKLKKEVAAKK